MKLAKEVAVLILIWVVIGMIVVSSLSILRYNKAKTAELQLQAQGQAIVSFVNDLQTLKCEGMNDVIQKHFRGQR